jgi:hypothetical protein
VTPLRRPLRRDNLDIEATLQRAAAIAPEVELGWSLLRQAMRDAGWPARMPDDDRRAGQGEETASIDYADTTGDLAVRLDNLADDLETLQDHWHLVVTSLRAMAVIARKHIPPYGIGVPVCSVSSCDQSVETTGNGGYRGMDLVAGMWVCKPGIRPVCAKHRAQHRRVPREMLA